MITTPAFFLANLQPGSTTIDATIASPSEYVAGRNIVVPSGRVLGGGSSVNFMKYTRPSASDFDDWKMEGWTFKDVKPLFKKVSCSRSLWKLTDYSSRRIMLSKERKLMGMRDLSMFPMEGQ
jgi:choline dehydrogenase-like flavoprotein